MENFVEVNFEPGTFFNYFIKINIKNIDLNEITNMIGKALEILTKFYGKSPEFFGNFYFLDKFYIFFSSQKFY